MTTEAELAWAGGLFEGEGWITVGRVSGKPKRQLGLMTTDYDVLCRFRSIVQVGQIGPPRLRGNFKPIWMWQTGKMRDIERTLILLMPWLGARRAAKACECLADCANSRIAKIDHLHANGVRTTEDLVRKQNNTLNTNSRASERCKGSSRQIVDATPGKIVDCPECGRPMRLMRSQGSSNGRIGSHGTIATRNTRAADERLRMSQAYDR